MATRRDMKQPKRVERRVCRKTATAAVARARSNLRSATEICDENRWSAVSKQTKLPCLTLEADTSLTINGSKLQCKCYVWADCGQLQRRPRATFNVACPRADRNLAPTPFAGSGRCGFFLFFFAAADRGVTAPLTSRTGRPVPPSPKNNRKNNRLCTSPIVPAPTKMPRRFRQGHNQVTTGTDMHCIELCR